MSANEVVKSDEQLPGQMDIFDFIKPKTTVSMFGREWHLMSEAPKGITEYDRLEVLGTYPPDKWSICKACLENNKIVPLNVPWDIPYPDFQYWRLKEKAFSVDIRGICDDAYCPKCNICLDENKYLDCERCPNCGIGLNWEKWHFFNDEEEI